VSAEQVQRVLDDLAARRAQVQALRDQLATFDEALGALEANLRPMAEWTRTWAALEKSVADFFRPPGAGTAG
jgi:acyl carrier protein phosphodiesterase